MLHLLPQSNERYGTLHLRLPLATVQSQSTDYPCPTAVRGLHWTMAVYRTTDDHLAVFVRCVELSTMPDLNVKTTVNARLIGVDDYTTIVKSFHHDFTAVDKTGRGFIKFVAWDRLIDASNGFVVDGALTIEVDVRPSDPMGMVDRASWNPPHFDVFNIDNVLAPDMHIEFDGVRIACNKSTIWRHCKPICDAMTKGKSQHSPVYVVPMEGLQLEDVRQFVTATYNGWDEAAMDRRVIALYRLANRYVNGQVLHMTMIALKRLLTDATFWPTMAAVVTCRYNPEIIRLCARYAVATPGRLLALIDRSDGQSDEARAELLKGIALLTQGEGRDDEGAGGISVCRET